jgi:hypothetical protein
LIGLRRLASLALLAISVRLEASSARRTSGQSWRRWLRRGVEARGCKQNRHGLWRAGARACLTDAHGRGEHAGAHHSAFGIGRAVAPISRLLAPNGTMALICTATVVRGDRRAGWRRHPGTAHSADRRKSECDQHEELQEETSRHRHPM